MFLHENPAHARSWALPCIRKLMRNQGVYVVEADQCMFGLSMWGEHWSQLMLAKKATMFMTNSQPIGRKLDRRCDGTHKHQPLLDGRAKDAAWYPAARRRSRGIAKGKMQRACGKTVFPP